MRRPTRPPLSRSTLAGVVALLGSMVAAAAADEPDDGSPDRRFVEVVRPVLKGHCLACHGET